MTFTEQRRVVSVEHLGGGKTRCRLECGHANRAGVKAQVGDMRRCFPCESSSLLKADGLLNRAGNGGGFHEIGAARPKPGGRSVRSAHCALRGRLRWG